MSHATIPSTVARPRRAASSGSGGGNSIDDLPVLMRVPNAYQGAIETTSADEFSEMSSDEGTLTGTSPVSPVADETTAQAPASSKWNKEGLIRVGWRVGLAVGAVVLMFLMYRFINGTPAPNEADTDSEGTPNALGGGWEMKSRPLTEEEMNSSFGDGQEQLPRFSTTPQPTPTVVTPENDGPMLQSPQGGAAPYTLAPGASPAGDLDAQGGTDRRPWNQSPAVDAGASSQNAVDGESNWRGQPAAFRRDETEQRQPVYQATDPRSWREFNQPVAPYNPPTRDSAALQRRFNGNNQQSAPSWRREQPGVASLRGIEDAPLR